MSTYWVQYIFNIDIQPSGPSEPPNSPLTFQGHTIFNDPSVVFGMRSDPTPFVTTFNNEFFFDQEDLGTSDIGGQIVRQFIHSSIYQSYLVGSEPDPTQLLGLRIVAPPLPGVPDSNYTYYASAWEQITINPPAELSHINHDILVPLLPGGTPVPTYGNYGGPGYTGGQRVPDGTETPDALFAVPPVDALDELFRAHDLAYNEAVLLSDDFEKHRTQVLADWNLIAQIVQITPDELGPDGHEYAGLTILAFIHQINENHAYLTPEEYMSFQSHVQDYINNAGEQFHLYQISPQSAALNPADFGSNVRFTGSPLIDGLFYDARYTDVLLANVDPEAHYNQSGWHESRNPNAFFDTRAYELNNPDVASAGVNPLQHYDASGWRDGRDPSANFSTNLYLLQNPDVKAANIDPLAHYLQYGVLEGRQAPPAIGHGGEIGDFDPHYYLLANPDVAAAVPQGANADQFAYQQYETLGWREGRDPNAFFSTNGYLNAYADVRAAGINPLDHYEANGWLEGRDPSPQFDTNQYIAHYTDVAAAHIDPLQHYLTNGAWENRLTFGDGRFA